MFLRQPPKEACGGKRKYSSGAQKRKIRKLREERELAESAKQRKLTNALFCRARPSGNSVGSSVHEDEHRDEDVADSLGTPWQPSAAVSDSGASEASDVCQAQHDSTDKPHESADAQEPRGEYAAITMDSSTWPDFINNPVETSTVLKLYDILAVRLFHTTRFLCARGLALRGNSHKLGDPGNGNWLGVLEVVTEYDDLLREHLRQGKA
ncbi:hypothetical protein FOZ60_003798 [Perkinsus olseni]|uniref:Uncharacterized protein n=1 Tax=Perkinsus olseni TaxID=32597 RepID=A0A7J6NVJ4_PEROL|nr:hypothetical protein FOZ60_003798 [Perkinsus olseni]